MKHILKYVCIAAALTSFTSPALAEEGDFVSLGVGWYDINDDQDAGDFRLEFRSGKSLLTQDLHPWVGFEGTTDGSVWGGGGVLYDWEFSPQWHLIPNFGVGLYGQGGSDKDLGHVIEFRSQLEVAYEYEGYGHRIGAAFGHLSNASLDDENPGTEVLNLYYHIPW